jgi:hypothetical protein
MSNHRERRAGMTDADLAARRESASTRDAHHTDTGGALI